MIKNQIFPIDSTGPHGHDQSSAAAGFSSRGMALAIDGVFLVGLVCFTLFFFGRLVVAHPPTDGRGLVSLLISSMFLVVVWPLLLSSSYFVVLHSFGGQTLGKVFMGIRVISDEGRMLSLGGSFLRLIGYLLSITPMGAGFLWAAIDRDHAAWHDKLACSRVINL
jgi:uncharacterized RDD family membrane protein YckC